MIRAESLSKKYRLGDIAAARSDLRHVMHDYATSPLRWLARGGRRDPAVESRHEFHALRDVSFEVKRGEVVGIIGRNGAGKSTLLKIFSRITEPTSGRARISGRVAALLEVGTGFHPELTGRENIFLNGAILGMTKADIRQRFDEIVAFAEIDEFLDTPVKRYSSGMHVRLAFAVAAHLEPEVLLIDEALAVGDAAFQRKCLGKIGDFSAREGRTVLFVSHNLAAVEKLCTSTIWLDHGRVERTGGSTDVIAAYLATTSVRTRGRAARSGFAQIELEIVSADGHPNVAFVGQPVVFTVALEVDRPVAQAAFGIGINAATGERVVTLSTSYQRPEPWNVTGSVRLKVEWPECILCPGTYEVVCGLEDDGRIVAAWEDAGELVVLESDYFQTGRLPDPRHQGRVVTKANWTIGECA